MHNRAEQQGGQTGMASTIDVSGAEQTYAQYYSSNMNIELTVRGWRETL